MGRAKVTLKHIQNEKVRAQTFKGRMNGLMKKMNQFSTMTKVEACLIVYEGNGGAKPITWPQNKKEARSIIEKYETQKKERSPRNFDLKDFFENRKNMVEAEISKVRKDIVQNKYPTWNSVFTSLDEEQRMNFITMLDTKIAACNQRVDMLKNNHQQPETSIKSKQNMAQSKSVALAPNPSQLNSMQNTSQIRLIPTPMMPVNHNNPLATYVVDHGMCSQSQMSHFDPNLMHLAANNNGMVDPSNQVGVPLDSTIQNGPIIDPTNQLGEFVDLAKFCEYENWTSQPNELVDWTSQLQDLDFHIVPQFENVPQHLRTLPPTMDEVLIYGYNNNNNMYQVQLFDHMNKKGH